MQEGSDNPKRVLIFSGKVLPERCNVNFDSPSVIYVPTYGAVVIKILKSIVTVELSIDNANNDSLSTLKNFVEGMVRVIVDTLGFCNSCGYDVEISSVFDISSKDMVVYGVQERLFRKTSG